MGEGRDEPCNTVNKHMLSGFLILFVAKNLPFHYLLLNLPLTPFFVYIKVWSCVLTFTVVFGRVMHMLSLSPFPPCVCVCVCEHIHIRENKEIVSDDEKPDFLEKKMGLVIAIQAVQDKVGSLV